MAMSICLGETYEPAVPNNVAILNCGVISLDAHLEGEYEEGRAGLDW